ncbi:hypothetical protein GCM10010425_50590 [Streptomyces spororaveus]|uniref:Uncharacterized protein n=1 Tax=Streptomyces spororaveus TaxID=284039 RepID=A0ABQ3T2P7_9ACTN|nr:hypothetical protein Sspor_02140 [Streptomyces spororaveus]
MSQSTPSQKALTHFKNPARVSPTSRDNTSRPLPTAGGGAGAAVGLGVAGERGVGAGGSIGDAVTGDGNQQP